MKKLLKSSLVLTFFAMSIVLFQMSCKKEAAAETIIPLTKEQILVAKTWKVDQIHNLISGSYTTYTEGGTNTTGIDYGKLRFSFNANGTGSHTNNLGVSYTTTWLLSADKRSITITVNEPTPFTHTWQMVEIAGNYLHATVRLTLGGNPNNIIGAEPYKG